MPEQHLLPIALPRGRSGNTGFLTVYYAPRLKQAVPNGLMDYPEWMHWPDTLNSLTIQLRLGDSATSVWVTPTAVGISPDPDKWTNTFRGATPIKPHRFIDWSQTPLLPVPTSDFTEAVLDLYASIAANYPTNPPPGNDLLGVPDAAVLSSDALDAVVSSVEPMEMEGEKQLEEPRDPEWDFHEYVSMLGAHPEVLRHLGLAVEYEFQFPGAFGDPVSAMVRTNYEGLYGGNGAREVRVVTRTTKDFFAESSPFYREQDGGFLQLEVQKAYLSILDSYSTAGRLNQLGERVTDSDGSLPALTTRALTLVRPDLLAAFLNRTTRQNDIESAIYDQLYAGGGPVEIYAEDQCIGYHIDVLHLSDLSGGTWRSLFERQTDANGYQFLHDPTLNLTPDPDEGWTQTILVTEIDEQFPSPNPDQDFPIQPYALRRLDDQLYRWDGWSGAVRPPGSALDGTSGDVAETGPDVPDTNAWVQFAANYVVVPGTLPRLRFGETYQMRARCVDLAGNAMDLAAKSPAGTETKPETFGRLEPIAAPFVVRRAPRPVPGVGDEAVSVVLLSDYDIDDSKVEGQERLMFPGAVGQELCELHDVPNGGADPASYAVLADRSARAPADQWSVDPVSGEPVAEGNTRQNVAYLSDPFIERLRAYHYGEFQEYLAGLTGVWPAVTSSRLEVVAGAGSTEVNPDPTTELRFYVEKADILPVDLSYAPPVGEIDKFGLWHRISGADPDALRTTIERGGHWMFSARRPIRLIHAVRRPLLAPRVETWSHTRQNDSTGITITTTLQAERRSTGRVTLRARWTDLVDDVSQPGPAPRDGAAWLGRFTTPRDVNSLQYTIDGHRAELGDTKRHAATIDVEAFSSFSSYFTEERVVEVERAPIVVDERGFAKGTVVVRYGKEAAEAKLGIDYNIDENSGTLKRTRNSALKLGSDVTVRYVPLPVSRTSDEFAPFEVVFPNTATPPRPLVESVIPAFARARSKADHVTHDGRVVRVYLKRPWNLTGDGEALAVLVERSPGPVSNATRLGRDPIVTGASALPPVSVGALTNAYATVENYDGVHDLAMHTVVYDEASGRWFADIAVDTDVYRPFLQLVIARYQADSIPGRHLGPPVTLEPSRLGVSRSVTLTQTGDGYDVVVAGVEHAGIPADADSKTFAQNEVTATLQEADSNIADADLRWLTDLDVAVLQRAAGPDGTTWSGHVVAQPSGAPQRLVIEESEPALFGGETPDLVGSVIYTEVMELPAS